MLQDYLPLLGSRQHSMTAIIDLLPPNPTIVETGCARQEDNWAGDGMSTVIWDALVAERGGKAYSVDIDLDAVQLAQRLCPRVQVAHGDSVGFLGNLTFDRIDLLYLDAVDFPVDPAGQFAAALHCLYELTAVARCRPRLVMFDDTVCINQRFFYGKGALASDYLRKVGAEIVIADRCQCAWRL